MARAKKISLISEDWIITNTERCPSSSARITISDGPYAALLHYALGHWRLA